MFTEQQKEIFRELVREAFQEQFIPQDKDVFKELAREVIHDELRKYLVKRQKRIKFYEHPQETLDSSVGEFIDKSGIKFENRSVGELYLEYGVFCRTKEFRPISKIAFSKEVTKITGLESKVTSVNGRSVRLFVK